MEIIKKSKEDFTVKELYDLTRSPEIQKMSTIPEVIIALAAYVVYKDTNNKGQEQTIVCVKTEDGTLFATNSPTFASEFLAIIEMCETAKEPLKEIKVIEGKSKAGRNYITCAYIA